MLNKSIFYKLFLITMAISPFISYFTGSGVITFIFMLCFVFIIILLEITSSFRTKIKDWLAILMTLPFVVWGSFVNFLSPYNGQYVTIISITFLTLPFIILSTIRLKRMLSPLGFSGFLYKIIMFFCVAQLVVCIGQIATYSLGIGFPVNESYVYMISGTFYNANDLSAIILVIVFIYTGIEKISHYQKKWIWILLFSLLLITGSRSALLIGGILFIITRDLNFKNLIFSLIIYSSIYYVFFVLLSSTSNDVLLRFSSRLISLVDAIELGLESDSSVSIRTASYMHFLNNLGGLGFGSGEFGNYTKYADRANFDTDLMFFNPHSLIVEIAYWLGLPGLLTFFASIYFLFQYSKSKVLLFIVLMISSLIPSTVFLSPVYFLFAIFAFFTHTEQHKDKLILKFK